MATKVAVVGAGPLGLMALKNLKEDGFDVTGHDAREFVGGLYRSAISDFPFADDVDDFPTWRQLHDYLEDYCDHFDLRPHIKLRTKATGLRREEDRWGLEVAPKDAEPRVDWYDKVVVSVGSFVKPKSPSFEGIELFEGTAVHAFNYRRPQEYKDKKVLLISLHATTQDVAVSLSKYASKVYRAHNNGLILFPRYTADYAAFGQAQSLNFFFFQAFMSDWFPNLFNRLIDKIILSMAKKGYPNVPEKWNFSPAPSIAITAPLIADEIYPLLESGFAEPCSAVKQIIGPKTVELTDGNVLKDIDAIIYCTGYDMAVPFLPAEFNPYPVIGEPPMLYRNVFPINKDPAIRGSLAILGQAAIPFPGFTQHELIGMAVSQVWRRKTQLPSYEDMQKWRRGYLAWREDLLSRQKIKSTFYVGFQPMADHIKRLDKVAGTGMFENFGWSWKAWSFWWTDRELYKKCKTGLFSPAIWRLFETGRRKAWPDARKQIFEDNLRAEQQIKERMEMMEKQGKNDKDAVLSGLSSLPGRT